jgi:hypothetical protein
LEVVYAERGQEEGETAEKAGYQTQVDVCIIE